MAAGFTAAVKGDPKVAAALIGFGAGMYIVGSLHEINADKDKPGPAEASSNGADASTQTRRAGG